MHYLSRFTLSYNGIGKTLATEYMKSVKLHQLFLAKYSGGLAQGFKNQTIIPKAIISKAVIPNVVILKVVILVLCMKTKDYSLK